MKIFTIEVDILSFCGKNLEMCRMIWEIMLQNNSAPLHVHLVNNQEASHDWIPGSPKQTSSRLALKKPVKNVGPQMTPRAVG